MNPRHLIAFVLVAALLMGIVTTTTLDSFDMARYAASVVHHTTGVPKYGARVIHKFGSNPTPTADEDIWDCPDIGGPDDYPYESSAFTLYASSDNAGDDTLTLLIEGLDSNWERQQATHTLGSTSLDAVTAADSWIRIFRAYNTSATAFTGNIYLSASATDAGGDGVPDDLTKLQACILPGNEQTLMAIYTTAEGESTWITQFCASAIDTSPGTPGYAELVGMARANFPTVGVFRVQTLFGMTSNGTSFECREFPEPLYITPRTDLKGRINAVSLNSVTATYDLTIIND